MEFRSDPFFEDIAPPPMPMFPHMGLGLHHHGMHHHHHPHSMALSPFGGMGMGLMPFGGPSPFLMMNNMMPNMNGMMRQMQRQAESGNSFSSSSTTVMSYSSDGQGGQPRVYHASSSTTQGPGGVKETRKAVKDSHSGVQKMAVGHHIGDRSHVIERQVNAKTGERAENQEFINLDETEAGTFGEEWKEKTHRLNPTSSLLHPSLGQSHRDHFAQSRGLPSTSQPRNPEAGERGEGKPTKRRHRPASMSGEDGLELPQATATSSRSPKLSRTRSPPYVPKPRPSHPVSHSHSSHADVSPVQPTATMEPGTRTTHKKKGGKTTTFAL